MGPRICISNEFLGDNDGAGDDNDDNVCPGTTLWEPLG